MNDIDNCHEHNLIDLFKNEIKLIYLFVDLLNYILEV